MRIKSFLTLTFLVFSLLCSSHINASKALSENDPFIVVLDAGHGGHDPGNLGNGYLEKQIALNIVLKVGEILSSNKDIKVIYTRKDDTFIDLYVRGEVANKANADLFVSVHCDSHSSDAHGAGTFVLGLHANKQNFEIAKKENSVIYLEDNYETRYANYDINSPESVIGLTIMQEEFLDQSIALAKMIQDNFSNKLKRTDRKVKQAGFIVLHQTFMPSVLVETGFLTNKDEGAYLNSKKGQNEMGVAIANAILDYKAGAKGTTGQNTTPTPSKTVSNDVEVKVKDELKIDKASVAVIDEVVIGMDSDIVKEKREVEVINRIASAIETDPTTEEDVVFKKENSTKDGVTIETIIPVAKEEQDIIFKVQLMASSKNVPLTRDNFNGLGQLSKEPYKNMYRYLYGETNSYNAAKKIQSNAVLKGYDTAYVVAYRNGIRITLQEALQQVSQ